MKLLGMGIPELAIVGFVFAVRVGLSIAAASIAQSKGQSFAAFLIVGLFLGALPTFVVAAAMKPVQLQYPLQRCRSSW